jgi:hypothetical protein
VSPRYPVRQRQASSYETWRENSFNADIETRAFWNYMTAQNVLNDDPRQQLTIEEQRVLSKGASGGGFLVPTDLVDQIVSAARAQSALAQLALEFVTSDGATFNVPLGARPVFGRRARRRDRRVAGRRVRDRGRVREASGYHERGQRLHHRDRGDRLEHAVQGC